MDPEQALLDSVGLLKTILKYVEKGKVPSKHFCCELVDKLQGYYDWRFDKKGFEPEIGDVGGDELFKILREAANAIPDQWMGA